MTEYSLFLSVFAGVQARSHPVSKKFLSFAGASHNDTCDAPNYFNAIVDFVQANSGSGKS